MTTNLQSAYTGQEEFGISGNIGKDLDDSFMLTFSSNIATIGFYLLVPEDGSVAFEATFDGITWEGISMRSIDNDLFQSSTSDSGNYIGSVAGIRQFRFRTSDAGSELGTVKGKAQSIVSVIENIEFGAPPHKFGYLPVHKDANFTEAQTGANIWVPESGKKFIITDLDIICGGTTDANITIFDEINTSGNILFRGTVDVSNNKQFKFTHPYQTPYVSSDIDNVLKITTNANITIDIMMHGYEV